MDQDKKPQDEQQPVIPAEGQETDPGVVVEPQAEIKPQDDQSLPGQTSEQSATPSTDEPVAGSDLTAQQEPANQPITPPVSPVAPSTDTPAATSTEPRNFLVAFLMVLSFGYFGLHQVYLGHKTQGWIRFALGVLSYPLMFLLVGFLIVPVLAIWAVVDFFMLYLGKRVDADGQPLTATGRDSSWAKVIFIISLVVWGFYLVSIVLAIVFGVVSSLQESALEPRTNLDYYNSY